MDAVTGRRTTRAGAGSGRAPTPGWGPRPAASAVEATGEGVTPLSRLCANFVKIDERRVVARAAAGVAWSARAAAGDARAARHDGLRGDAAGGRA